MFSGVRMFNGIGLTWLVSFGLCSFEVRGGNLIIKGNEWVVSLMVCS